MADPDSDIEIAQSCGNCRYSVMQDALKGTCNRYAPRPVTNSPRPEATRWPPVKTSYWCGEWTPPLTDDELFAYYLARSAGTMPSFHGIPVLPTDDPAPSFLTYDDPFEDPLR